MDESSVQMERSSSNKAQRSSCNRARIVLYRFIQRRVVLRSFYSATNRSKTVSPLRLSGWGVSYNGEGHFVCILLRKNDTITLYCHIPYFISYRILILNAQNSSITIIGSCEVQNNGTYCTNFAGCTFNEFCEGDFGCLGGESLKIISC